MLLVELTINAVLNRISNEYLYDLTNPWEHKIVSFTAPQDRIATNHGGYVQMSFGQIKLMPDLFKTDWPPPVECAINMYYTATDEASRETLFEGTAYLKLINKTEISYELYGDSYAVSIADATGYNDTLIKLFEAWCGGGILDLTLDSSAARAISPNVTHTTNGEQLAIDLASKVAAYYSHLFYIRGGTLYLIDMLLDNGTEIKTEFDFLPATYDWLVPISIASSGGRVIRSSYPYGRAESYTQYHDTNANIDVCLTDIVAIENKARARITIPFLGSLPVSGKKISFTDESQGVDTDMWIRARSLRYDFDKDEIRIEGEGVISAT